MSDSTLTAEDLSVYVDQRPFKSAAYLSKMGANGAPVPTRRNKTLKQILNQERDAYLQKRGLVEPGKKRGSGESTPKRRKMVHEKAEDSQAQVQEENEESVPATPSTAAAPAHEVPTCTFLRPC